MKWASISTNRVRPAPLTLRRIPLACLLAATFALTLAAQDDATLQFSVRATPTGGRPEKVMRHPFYLLRASLADIEKEVRQKMPAPTLEAFIEELPLSPELKDWMKRNHTVDLVGPAFLNQMTPDDILTVPEFKQAYVTRNAVMVGLGFPKRKAKLTDQQKNPAKWEASEKRYWDEVRAYATLHPDSKQGLDEHLLDITTGTEWKMRLERHEHEVQQRFMQLVHSDYLTAETETDYEGNARFDALRPGRYWLTNLWRDVRSGDVRLHWEVPVELRGGQRHYLELTNANAGAAVGTASAPPLP
ncbi:MAG: hypothetical protein ACRD35_00695 [Candidatus Acidiferrales bacterium]